MSAGLIAQVEVHDDSWIPEYAAKVHDIVHRHGGKYLSRSPNITTHEGEAGTANLIALLEIPGVNAAKAFASDPEYAPFAAARPAGLVSPLDIIDAVDAAGTIPYLPAAG